MMRWTAFEFADVCETVAAELRRRAHERAIVSTERLALFEWYVELKAIVVRLESTCERPRLAKAGVELDGSSVVRAPRAAGDRR